MPPIHDFDDHHAISEVERAVSNLLTSISIDPSARSMKMHATIAAMHGLCAAIDGAKDVLDGELLDKLLRPAFDAHSQAPFVKRLQDWPRGYAGDFETIEWLVEAQPRLSPDDPHYWIEWYSLNTAIAQQHRNKLAFQRGGVMRALRGGSRILSVGCGGARDMDELLDQSDAHVTLIDTDHEALELAKQRVSWATTIDVVHNDAIRGMRSISGRFDCIVFGGLFDYLDDRAVTLCLKMAARNLAPTNARILFTNVSDASTFGTFIENMARWRLILRSDDDVGSIVEAAGIDLNRLHIERDATGLSLLCTIEAEKSEPLHSEL